MPQLDITTWPAEAVAEQSARLLAEGAEPTITLRWLSQAERSQREQDRADEAYLSTLQRQALKGGAAVYSKRGHGH